MAKPRYDLTIYEPASAQMYRDDGPTLGGAEWQMVMLARSLAERDLRVCHVVGYGDGIPEERNGVDLVMEDRAVPGAGARARLARIATALGRADARVYLQRSAGLSTGLVGAFARLRRRRFVYSTSSPLDLTHGLPLLRHEKLGVKVGLRLTNAVVVQTREQEASAPHYLRVVRIPSFCEPAASSANDVRDYFLWAGRVVSLKNPLAFVELARTVPEARFVMVGVDPSAGAEAGARGVLEAAAGLPNIEVMPPIPRQQLMPLYHRAIAVVNTSDFEGFPNTFMEGWARGALALSLRVDPDGLIASQRIGTVAGGSLVELAAAARDMWRNRAQLGPARDRALRYVSKHHLPDIVAARWLELVRSLIS